MNWGLVGTKNANMAKSIHIPVFTFVHVFLLHSPLSSLSQSLTLYPKLTVSNALSSYLSLLIYRIAGMNHTSIVFSLKMLLMVLNPSISKHTLLYCFKWNDFSFFLLPFLIHIFKKCNGIWRDSI